MITLPLLYAFMLNEIVALFSVLSLHLLRLMISICVVGSTGKYNPDALNGMWVQLVLEDGMVPDYVK